MRPIRAAKAPQSYQATMKSQKRITIEKKIEQLLANGESPVKKKTNSAMRAMERNQVMGTPSQLECGESLAKKETNSFSKPMRAVQRKQFVGTPSQLRKLIKQILEPRFRGNIPVDSIVNMLTEAVVKDQELSRMMAENDVTMDLLLAAYHFCGKYIALENMDLTDVPLLEGSLSASEGSYATPEDSAEPESPRILRFE